MTHKRLLLMILKNRLNRKLFNLKDIRLQLVIFHQDQKLGASRQMCHKIITISHVILSLRWDLQEYHHAKRFTPNLMASQISFQQMKTR